MPDLPDRLFSRSVQRRVVYRPGHYGAALLAFAPVGAVLAVAGRVDLALVGGVVTLALAPLPDYDMRLPLVSHRGATHTVGFALVVGTALGLAGVAIAGGDAATTYGLFGFAIGVVSVGSHLAADIITPAGIPALWPVDDSTYSLRLVRSDNAVANYGLLAAGVFVTAVVALVFVG